MKKILIILLYPVVLFSQCQNAQITGDQIPLNSIPSNFEYVEADQILLTVTGDQGFVQVGDWSFFTITKNAQGIYGSSIVRYSNIDVANTSDDQSPIQINNTFIGGNHGESSVRNITATAHGKSNVDVGSEWLDGANRKWYIIEVVDANTIRVLSENIGATIDRWRFELTINGSVLNHSQGATNTSAINIESVVNSQLFPAIKNHSYSVLMDGVNAIPSGSYTGDVLVYTESYDIVNPVSMLNNLILNVGNVNAPDFTNGDTVCNIQITRTFYSDMSSTVDYRFENYKSVDLNYIGATQAGKMVASGTYPNVYISLPNTTAVGGNDYNGFVDITSNLPSQADFILPNNPIRAIAGVGNGSPSVFFAHGYHYDQEVINNRDSYTNKAWEVYTSAKSYPRFVENINDLPVNTVYNVKAYRNYFVDDDLITSYSYKLADELFTYIDFKQAGSYEYKLPKGYCGYSVEELQNVSYEKTGLVTTFSSTGVGYALIRNYN